MDEAFIRNVGSQYLPYAKSWELDRTKLQTLIKRFRRAMAKQIQVFEPFFVGPSKCAERVIKLKQTTSWAAAYIYIYIYMRMHIYIYGLHFSICACHHCVRAMLIFSVSFLTLMDDLKPNPYTYAYVYIYIYAYICICICMYLSIYIHTRNYVVATASSSIPARSCGELPAMLLWSWVWEPNMNFWMENT